MVEIIGGGDIQGDSLPMANLPPTALQALYHHVTGKTENMSQSFKGNVLIRSTDVDVLHQMILDQVATHHVEFGPTVTVEVKHANNRAFHHSSWDHFKKIIPVGNEITSEITIKFEFVLNLQNTVGPQRCSISILLDSSLPIISNDSHRGIGPYGPWIFFNGEWTSAKVSIDFVDFMVARGFVGVVEEWFKSLKPSPTPSLNRSLLNKYEIFSSISSQMGRVGFSIFLAIYIYSMGDKIELIGLSYAVCLGFLVWSFYAAIRPPIISSILKRITRNIVPTVILLNSFDLECYEKLEKSLSKTRGTIIKMILTISLNISINIASSLIYSYI